MTGKSLGWAPMNKLSAQHVEIFSKAILESETDDTAYMRWHYPLLVHLRKAQSPNRFPYNKNQAHHKTAYLLFDEDMCHQHYTPRIYIFYASRSGGWDPRSFRER